MRNLASSSLGSWESEYWEVQAAKARGREIATVEY
jgi:hypothetical protein